MSNHTYADFRRPAHPFREELPIYAAALAIGIDAEAAVPGIAAHLATCLDCATELHELLETARSSYAGALTPTARYPVIDLAFLGMPTQPPLPVAPVWQLEDGRLTIRFSPALLSRIRQQPLAGAARGAHGELIFRYTQDPGSVRDLDVSIEVYTEDAAHQQGRVHVGVDVTSRSPLNQHGSLVTLHLGESSWAAETDETGGVDFASVPLADLPSLHVEITPLREIEN
jgi:hypothetical protein